jgi:hypothetical protein
MKVLPILLKDGYKVGHKFQYPENTTLVYSNLTPRKSRSAGDAYLGTRLRLELHAAGFFLVDQYAGNRVERRSLEVRDKIRNT